MDADLLQNLGQIAGIGGIALGAFVLLFREIIRKSVFPRLRKDDAYQLLKLISVCVFLVAIAGIGAWAWSGGQANVRDAEHDTDRRNLEESSDIEQSITIKDGSAIKQNATVEGGASDINQSVTVKDGSDIDQNATVDGGTSDINQSVTGETLSGVNQTSIVKGTKNSNVNQTIIDD